MTDTQRPSTLPAPGLVATFEGRDCLLMPLFAGEETTVELGPYTLTIRCPGDCDHDSHYGIGTGERKCVLCGEVFADTSRKGSQRAGEPRG
jgi:hypothetical protein